MIYKLMITLGAQALTVAILFCVGLFSSCSNEKDYWEGNSIIHLAWEGSEPSYVRPVEIGDPSLWIYPHSTTEALAIDVPDINVLIDLPEGVYDLLVLSDNTNIRNNQSFYTATLSQETEPSESGELYIVNSFSSMLYVGVYSSYQALDEKQQETSITVKPYLKEFFVDILFPDTMPLNIISCNVEITGIITSSTIYNRQSDESTLATVKLPLQKLLSPSGDLSFHNTFYLIDRSRENFLRCYLTDEYGNDYYSEIDISNHIYLSEMAFTASLVCKDLEGETFTLSIGSEEAKEDNITIKPS